MKKFKIIHVNNEIRDNKTNDVVCSTLIPDTIKEYFDRETIDPDVIKNVVSIWNKSGVIDDNLGSGGDLDTYLLDEGRCTQEEREVIVESLYDYANK